MLSVEFPLRTGSGLNGREHPMQRHRRVKGEREAVAWYLRGKPPAPPILVTLTRKAPSDGLDDDNLVGALKGIRDAVAKWLGIDDKDPRVKYLCAQERGPWGVRIQIGAAE